jgi:hypothetical protein
MLSQSGAPLLTVRQFAQRHGVAVRTVERWQEDGHLSGVVRLDSGNLIPDQPRPAIGRRAAAAPEPLEQRALAVPAPAALEQGPRNLAEALALLPAFLTLEDAARLLGIPVVRIKENPERFAAEPVDDRRQLMVPARVVREVAGI